MTSILTFLHDAYQRIDYFWYVGGAILTILALVCFVIGTIWEKIKGVKK